MELTEAQQALIEEHEPWARQVARRRARSYGLIHCREDLEATALVALNQVAAAFDPKLGDFRPFAKKRVCGAISDAVAKELRHLAFLRMAMLEMAASRSIPTGTSDAAEQVNRFAAELMMDAHLLCFGEEARLQGEAGLLQLEEFRRLHQALDQLQAQERRLVDLRYFRGLSWKQVAEQLGLPERTAKDHDHRIRAVLLRFLKER